MFLLQIEIENKRFRLDSLSRYAERPRISCVPSDADIACDFRNDNDRPATSPNLSDENQSPTPEGYTSFSTFNGNSSGSSLSRSPSPLTVKSFELDVSSSGIQEAARSPLIPMMFSSFDMNKHSISDTCAKKYSSSCGANSGISVNARLESMHPTCDAQATQHRRDVSSEPSSVSDTSSSNRSSVDREEHSPTISRFHAPLSGDNHFSRASKHIQFNKSRASTIQRRNAQSSRKRCIRKNDTNSSFVNGPMEIELRSFCKSSSSSSHNKPLQFWNDSSNQSSSALSHRRLWTTLSPRVGVDESDIESLGSDVCANDFDGFFTPSISSTLRNTSYYSTLM